MSLTAVRICDGCKNSVNHFPYFYHSAVSEHGDIDLCPDCHDKLMPLVELLKEMGDELEFKSVHVDEPEIKIWCSPSTQDKNTQ